MSFKRRLRGSMSAGPTPSGAPSRPGLPAPTSCWMPRRQDQRQPRLRRGVGLPRPAAPRPDGAACGLRCAAACGCCDLIGAVAAQGDAGADPSRGESGGDSGASTSAGMSSMRSTTPAAVAPAAEFVRMRPIIVAADGAYGRGDCEVTATTPERHQTLGLHGQPRHGRKSRPTRRAHPAQMQPEE